MKHFKTLLLTIISGIVALSSCTKAATTEAEKTNMLVCYFSATGTTAEAAQRIATLTGADVYEITPVDRYTDADLDWTDSLSRSSVEMHDKTSRPAIVIDSLPDMAQYDVVFIGFPNWWNTFPTVVNTFIETVDLDGKTVVPFMTSGSSSIENSEKDFHETYPTLTFAPGLRMNGVSDEEITEWVKASRQAN